MQNVKNTSSTSGMWIFDFRYPETGIWQYDGNVLILTTHFKTNQSVIILENPSNSYDAFGNN